MFKRSFKSLLLVCLMLSALLPVLAQDVSGTPVEVRLMTFNIWLGGDVVNFGKVIESIQAANADVVALQEPNGNTRRIADLLGWPYASDRTHVISRYPLIDISDDNYIYVEVAPGQVIAVANVHLTSDPYGPDAVAQGKPLSDVLTIETETRLPEIDAVLTSLSPLVKNKIPVLLAGDFNTPSHLDWTEETVGARPQMKYAVAWPVTKAVEKAGFADTFRAVYPDPVANPGITWSYGHPYPFLNPNDALDRIDLIFAANADEILDSKIIGDAGTPNVDFGITSYPSDHRAVVSTVRVTPASLPPFVWVDQRVLTQGERLVARYHTPVGESVDRLVVVPAGGSPVKDALMTLPPYEAIQSGSVTFGTSTLKAGAYEVLLTTTDQAEVSRRPFWVRTPEQMPSITTDQTTYTPGQTITVTWKNAPAMQRDWIAVYPRESTNFYSDYLFYVYTNATVEGTTTIDTAALKDLLPPGDYVINLLKDDGYELLASASFSIGEPEAPIVN